MSTPLKVLIAEDLPSDAQLLVRELRRVGFEPDWQRVDTEEAYLAQLDSGLDLVLSDYEMPQFNGLRALELLGESGLDIPLIIVSGTIGEETAVEAMRRGAADYLLKDRLARLGPAVSHAMAQSRLRREGKQTHEALRLFRALIDQSNDIFEVIDAESARFLDVNERGPAELGCTREEYLSMRVFDVDPTVNPSDWPQLVAGIREAGFLEGEGFHVRKDGTSFPFEFSSRWVRLDRDYIVAALRNISARKQAESALRLSEERFRQLAENINEVFWMTDPAKEQMLYVSPAYEAIWGRSCESLYAAPLTWAEAIHPEDRIRILHAAKTKQKAGTYDEQYRILRGDGSSRWIRDRAFPVRAADGTISRIVGLAEDITESKSLREQYLRAQRMEAIGTLAGGIAHDLNNILSPVLMAPTLLKESAKTEHDRHLLDLIEQAGRRASSVVRQLLTFSRGSGGERVSVQLRHLLKEMVDIMRETFPRDLEIEHNAANDLRTVMGDPTQFHQVLLNLCVNARDAMPEGGKLSLTARNTELGAADVKEYPPAAPGLYVAVSVTDTGHGIPPEIADRIFDPFFTTKPPTKGTGLCLSTVLGIVRSHNGFITVASKPGQGTTFTVYLPASPASEEATSAPSAGAPSCGHGELILVIDDEDSIRTATRLMLEQKGYRVLTANEGAEGLAIFLKNHGVVRLVLTDVMMPVMGGVTLIRALRAIDPKLRIIATSGLTDQTQYDELKAVGVNAIVAKPWEVDAILEAIREQLTPSC